MICIAPTMYRYKILDCSNNKKYQSSVIITLNSKLSTLNFFVSTLNFLLSSQSVEEHDDFFPRLEFIASPFYHCAHKFGLWSGCN